MVSGGRRLHLPDAPAGADPRRPGGGAGGRPRPAPEAAAEAEGGARRAAALGLRAHRRGARPGARRRACRSGRATRPPGRRRAGSPRASRLRPHRHRPHGVRPGRDRALPHGARHRAHGGARHGPRRGGSCGRCWCATAGETRRLVRRAQGLAVVDDPSNDDPAHARARVRARAAARARGGPPRRRGARRRRWRTLLRDEAELLDPLVEAAWSAGRARGPGLDPGALAAEPRALRRLLVRRLIAEAGLAGDALGGEPVARALGHRGRRSPPQPPGRGRGEPGGRAPRRLRARSRRPARRRPWRVPGATPFGAVVVRAAAAAAVAAATRPGGRAAATGRPRSARRGRATAWRCPAAAGARWAGCWRTPGCPPRLRQLVPVVADGRAGGLGGRPPGRRRPLVRDGSAAVVLELCPA